MRFGISAYNEAGERMWALEWGLEAGVKGLHVLTSPMLVQIAFRELQTIAGDEERWVEGAKVRRNGIEPLALWDP